ncbi:MAG: 3-phosphoglycerate dehydrogenase, partial [Pseudomonadales bacterium]
MYKIRTFNQIAVRGLDRFPRDQFEVSSDSLDPHAILLRSHALNPAELNPGLRAVARAGAGVNNVPVDVCTERGVVVFNTPGANANSVKELVLAGLLLASRDVVGGIGFVRSLAGMKDEAELDARVEAEKKRFKGRELKGRSLGVVGLGAIGSLVARAALDLGMEVLGFDPAISVDAAWRLPSEVRRMENLPSLFARADYVTLHVPLLPDTRGMINDASLKVFRPGSVLLNFARQPIVDAAALRAALDDGRVARYVADFPVPELTDHPNVLLTPHLGASTDEAEENCAVMAAEQLIEFLRTGNGRNSGNFPTVTLEPAGGHRLAVTNR